MSEAIDQSKVERSGSTACSPSHCNAKLTISVRYSDDQKVATYRSAVIPRIGETLDCNHGCFVVLDVWHDVIGDSADPSGDGYQTFVRVFVADRNSRT